MLKNLKLQRPLAFIDVETTGLKPNIDRIVELSILKVYPDGHHEYKSHRVNPEVPIPAEATEIHGITDSDVENEPPFRKYAKSVRDFLNECDLSGFNVIKFDLPFLEAEFTRAGVEFSRRSRYFIDSQVIYHQRDPRNLEAAFLKYCGREMENAHAAEEDAKASALVLDGQLEMHQDLPRDVQELSKLCYQGIENCVDVDGKFVWVNDEVVCNFGKKHKGRRLRDIAQDDPSYLSWIIGADFSLEVREIAENALDGSFPELPT